MYRVGIDIGGTFTDMLLVGDDGSAVIAKTLTTPGDPSLAVENALRPVLENGSVDPRERGTLIHGTTLVTNALIERKGALTALLTTVGFRDAVEIGREHRYELYDLNLDLPKPLVPRHLRFDVPERMAADGTRDRRDEQRHAGCGDQHVPLRRHAPILRHSRCDRPRVDAR